MRCAPPISINPLSVGVRCACIVLRGGGVSGLAWCAAHEHVHTTGDVGKVGNSSADALQAYENLQVLGACIICMWVVTFPALLMGFMGPDGMQAVGGQVLTEGLQIQDEFLAELDPAWRFDSVLTTSLGVYFFAKDLRGRIVMANALTVERCGCRTEEELLGRTDYDFFPFNLADKYVADDRHVMETGEPIYEMMELAPDSEGNLNLYVTNKIPLHDRQGEVIGMAGAATCFEFRRRFMRQYLEVAEAVDHIKQHYREGVQIPALADLCRMAPRRFSEQFKEVLGLAPQTFVVLVRVHYACLELLRTDAPLAAVAEKVGFYDHSCFTRQFAKHMGMTPNAYRKRYVDNARERASSRQESSL